MIDTEIVVLANATVTRHVSAAQHSRWALLLGAINGLIVPVHSNQLVQEYVEKLSAAALSDIVKSFIRCLEKGISNYRPLLHHERGKLRECRYPSHDEHLMKTAKGLPNAVISAEEEPILRAARCVWTELGVRILSPSEAVDEFGLRGEMSI